MGEQGRQFIERHHVGAVARRAVGIAMGFHEDGGDADRHGGARQYGHELALAAAGPAPPAGLLYRMGGVEPRVGGRSRRGVAVMLAPPPRGGSEPRSRLPARPA